MFLFSGRVGALSSRYGPRLFMGSGPLVAAVGTLLLTQLDVSVDYLTDVLPAMLLFGAGLTLTVAPLTSTVMSGARHGDSGIASGVNNAVARSPACSESRSSESLVRAAPALSLTLTASASECC
jgi:predicted MFS family arabinose efflux permease